MAAQQAQLAGDFGFVAVALQLLPVGNWAKSSGVMVRGNQLCSRGRFRVWLAIWRCSQSEKGAAVLSMAARLIRWMMMRRF